MNPLTHEDVSRLQPGRRPDGTLKAVRYSFGDNLYLQVTPSGRSWLFRYDLKGKCRWMGLGPVDTGKTRDCLAAARQRAQDARTHLQEGRDPLAEKRARAAQKSGVQAGKTFADCASACIAAHESGWRSPIHARQWTQTLDDYVLPEIGRMPVADVGPADVKRVLAPLWKTKREVARKVCGKIGMILNYAIASGYREAANPASLRIMRTVLGPLQQKPVHHAAIPYAAVPPLISKVVERKDVPALALQWLIATATRSSEARGAGWSEIDTDKRVWRIPAARMKAGEPHDVPLSPFAMAVLERCKKRNGCEYVFHGPTGMPISDTSLRDLLRECEIQKDQGTLHGFRSSFRDWCAELGIADDVAEACLAHGNPDAVERAYKRTKFFKARTDVMERWGDYLALG